VEFFPASGKKWGSKREKKAGKKVLSSGEPEGKRKRGTGFLKTRKFQWGKMGENEMGKSVKETQNRFAHVPLHGK